MSPSLTSSIPANATLAGRNVDHLYIQSITQVELTGSPDDEYLCFHNSYPSSASSTPQRNKVTIQTEKSCGSVSSDNQNLKKDRQLLRHNVEPASQLAKLMLG